MNKKNKNGIILTASVLLLGGLAYLLVNKKIVLEKKADSPNKSNGASSENSDVSNLDYSQLADKLFSAFDGYGTANEDVYDVFSRLRSVSDFDKLVAAYGTRTVSSGKFNIFSNDFTGTLIETLRKEMNTSQLYKINQILIQKNISRTV